MKTLAVFLCLLAAAFAPAAAASPDITLRVAPERELYTRGARDVIVQIEVEGRHVERVARRTPLNLAVVLDRSGSMQGAKIEKARQAARVAIDQLADEDIFSLVMFDNKPEVLLAPERVGGARHRDDLKARIDRIQPGGGTAIHAGVTLGAAQLRQNFGREFLNRAILLSDGLANAGPSTPSELAALGSELRRESIAVTTVGVGDDYNEDLMTALAEASHGNYYYVRDAEKLPGIFSEELGATRSLLARGVTIRITVPRGVRLREIIGQPEIRVEKGEAVITLPEMFGAEKRRFLARCEVEEGAGEPSEVAQVALHYRDAAEGKTESPAQNAAVAVRWTEDAKKSDDSLRGDVAQEVAIARNRLAKAAAVKLADEGKTAECAQMLRSQAAANVALPAAAQSPLLAEENRALEATARDVESRGALDKSSRKQIQFENYQDKTKGRAR